MSDATKLPVEQQAAAMASSWHDGFYLNPSSKKIQISIYIYMLIVFLY